jgi:hypothetical protein
LKNQVQAILHRNLAPRRPVSDLFGTRGRAWLVRQDLPVDEHDTVLTLLRQLDFHGDELAAVDRDLAGHALADAVVRRLMTIPGIDAIVALSIVAAVGEFGRFPSPDKLVAYMGLNPESASPVGCRPLTAGSRRPAEPTHGACSSKRRGWPPEPQARCAPSSTGCATGAAPRSPSSPPPASSPHRAGT